MPQIHPLSIEQADADSAQKLSTVKAKIGMVPNVVGTLANSTAALNLYLASSQALSTRRLTPRQRGIIGH